MTCRGIRSDTPTLAAAALTAAPLSSEAQAPLHFVVVDTIDDAAWDAFVGTAAGGHYVQSRLWAKIKAAQGWQARYVLARDARGQIVAGAQILLKRLPFVGTVAVAYKAPVIAYADPELEARMVAEIHRAVKHLGAIYFSMQPPEGGERMAERLQSMGYEPCLGWGHTPVTTVLDLTQDAEQIGQRMHSDARRCLRRAQRAGVTMREGTAADVDLFYRLLAVTSQRQGFAIHSADFYHHVWQVGAPHGKVRLFFAELAGEPLSTEFALCFGDTVYGFKAGRSGRHERARPNELLKWEVFNWAKAHGYRRYDFVGVDSAHDLAFKVASGQVSREELQRSYTFKLSFGGDIITSPLAYAYVPNPLVRRIYAFARTDQAVWGIVNAVVSRARGITPRR